MSSLVNTKEEAEAANHGIGEKNAIPAAPDNKAVMSNNIYIDYAAADYLHLSHLSSSHSRRGTFPTKLYGILSDSTYADIIAWSPHGRSFKVLDKEHLMDVVGQKHFKFKKIESFYKMLNLWDFKRLHQPGPDHFEYYHEKF
ncbi:hypothetical protein HJC23_000617 [Cyclotella cryptica]|uniref:HSF-type DNA-binding domain-containing protein n=1 Tax=Cyclotella cryptica TaxID=29204 RepID=A0ABD3Q7X5_9STRA